MVSGNGTGSMNRLIMIVVLIGAVASALPMLIQHGEISTSPAKIARVETPKIESIAASDGSGTVRLKPDDRGHYVAEFKMNGRSVTALVDTGASMVAINKTTARKLGISVSPSDFKYEVSTANGNIKVAAAVIHEIQIGRVRVRDVEAAVLDDRALDGTLLGMSFLKRLDGFTVSKGDLILKQ
jgi:aspartyl protease family protein